MTDEGAEQASCAHIRVGYEPIHLPGGSMRPRWECLAGCGMEFVPAAVTDEERLAEIKARADADWTSPNLDDVPWLVAQLEDSRTHVGTLASTLVRTRRELVALREENAAVVATDKQIRRELFRDIIQTVAEQDRLAALTAENEALREVARVVAKEKPEIVSVPGHVAGGLRCRYCFWVTTDGQEEHSADCPVLLARALVGQV